MSRLRHENFVEMLGYCVEGDLRLLAYEFATMGSLHDVLHGTYFCMHYLCLQGLTCFSFAIQFIC